MLMEGLSGWFHFITADKKLDGYVLETDDFNMIVPTKNNFHALKFKKTYGRTFATQNKTTSRKINDVSYAALNKFKKISILGITS